MALLALLEPGADPAARYEGALIIVNLCRDLSLLRRTYVESKNGG